MISKMKAVCMVLSMLAVGIVSGCGGSGSGSAPQSSSGGSATGASSAGTSGTSASSAQLSAGAVLYASNCAGCHGDITATSIVTPTSLASVQGAIQSNLGGMGMLTSLSNADIQSIADAINNPAAVPVTPPPTPPTTVDGISLYASYCAGCHGLLASSAKKGITLVRLQNAITANTGNMGFLSTLTSAQQQSIVTALAVTVTPTPTPTPIPTPTTTGATLYAANCAGCHGALATSGKKGITLARLQNAITANTGNMGFLSTLTSAQQQSIVTALAVSTPVTPVPTPTPTPITDGATLYTANCAGCHGVLATSAKAGATAARIQTAINNNTGGMGTLTALTTTQVSAIATSLAVITPTPTPAPACGSCHAIPPATGHHATHKSQNVTCATCHGSGYSTTSFNVATHNNGVKNLTTTIGWNATSRSCTNSCHGKKSW